MSTFIIILLALILSFLIGFVVYKVSNYQSKETPPTELPIINDDYEDETTNEGPGGNQDLEPSPDSQIEDEHRLRKQ